MKQNRTTRLFILSFLALAAFLFFHCKKDSFNDTSPASQPGEASIVQYPASELSIAAAKAFYERKQEEIRLRDGDAYSDSIRQQMQALDLIWEGADTIWYKGNVPLLAVPVANDEAVILQRELLMVFFLDKFSQLDARLMLIYGADGFTSWNSLLADFDGVIVQVDWDGYVVDSWQAENGQITDKLWQTGGVKLRTMEVGPPCHGPGEAYAFGGMGIYITPCGFAGTSPTNDDPFGFGGGPIPPEGSGGAGGNSQLVLTNYFNLNDFEGKDRKIAQLINQFKENYGIVMSSQEIQDAIMAECQPSGDFFWWLKGNLPQDGGYAGMPECLKDVIMTDRIAYFHSQYGITLNEATLRQLFTDECLFTDNFYNCFNAPFGFVLSPAEKTWLNGHSVELQSIIGFYIENGGNAQVSGAIESMLGLAANNLLEEWPNNQREAIINEYFDSEDKWTEIVVRFTQLRHTFPYNGCVLNDCLFYILLKATYDVEAGWVHTGLDICGLAPLFGEPCDLVNGILYSVEGDGINAGLSFAATIPFAGWVATGAKFYKIACYGRGSGVAYTILKNVWDPQSSKVLFEGASQQQFRTMVGAQAGEQAHHIIPQATIFQNHAVVQAAAQANRKTFHIHHPRNGLPVSETRHLGSHANYNNLVFEKLNEIENTLGSNINPQDAANELYDLERYIESQIINNPTIHINNLSF